MSRLLSNVPPKKLSPKDDELPLLKDAPYACKNGFYKTSEGKKIFVFNGSVHYNTRYMTAWIYYNFATNCRTKKMSKEQFGIWERMLIKEGKDDFFYY